MPVDLQKAFKSCRLVYNFIKKDTLEQVFPCKFREIFENALFYRTPLVATSMPAMNATSEQSFSAIKYIKTYLRNTTAVNILSHCMMIYVYRQKTPKKQAVQDCKFLDFQC